MNSEPKELRSNLIYEQKEQNGKIVIGYLKVGIMLESPIFTV